MNKEAYLEQVTAIAGFRTRYGDVSFIPLVNNASLPNSSKELENKTDSNSELGPEEQELALRRWRQMKLVVGARLMNEEQNMAITRITGEEDVHGIENAEDVEKEISFSLLLVMSFI